jgi:hypothetical protein
MLNDWNPSHTNVSCKYGAPMGRGGLQPENYAAFAGKRVHLRRVRLDSGGYDRGGAYWGTGAPLFCAWDDESGEEAYLRAKDRDAAKAKLVGARFYR